MNPLFHPRLVNGSLGDPTLYIDFKFAKRAILFDLGEIRTLSPRQILKVSQIFISHTHMDHFIGFDHLLRICLGRDKKIHLFGPPNFLFQLKNKIAAYTWNLVENYPHSMELIVVEVHPDRVITVRLNSSTGFKNETHKEIKPFKGFLYEEISLGVRACFLDHKIPCLGFSLEEKSHLNIIKTELEKMGLSKGPWLRELKEAVWRGEGDDFMIHPYGTENKSGKERPFPLGPLKERVIKTSPGQKIAYVVDTVLNKTTQEAIENLVREADYLFIESAFLEEDGKRARDKYHLTARQAGIMAARAGVKRLIPFHLSPKYSADPERVREEALSAFREISVRKDYGEAAVFDIRIQGGKKTMEEDHRPWGFYRVLADEPDHKVKRIVVYPGKRLSLQRHQHRKEHWYLLSGHALVTRGEEQIPLKQGDSIDITKGELHRMENVGSGDLVFIEVQSGEYFGEEDIERVEDDFGRD